MHPNHMIQITLNAFASRYAGRRDDQLEFMKHIVHVVRQLPDSIPPAD
jgi:hypothetical protein